VQDIVPLLERNGLAASFEPHPGDFVEDSELGVQILREIGSKNVGYLYCCPHTFVLAGEGSGSERRTPEAMIRQAGKLVNFVHLADTHKMERIVVSFAPEGYASMRDVPKYKGMKTHEHLVPGDGEVDFRSVFTGLRAIDYDGPLSCIPFATDNPSRAARESLRLVKRFVKP
jgi:myo-inositol catabolism protein IolH